MVENYSKPGERIFLISSIQPITNYKTTVFISYSACPKFQ
jgi:hypothetical protein